MNTNTTTAIAICHHLRTKAYFVDGRDAAELSVSTPTAVYWCLKTMQVMGPDAGLVCPEECHSERQCFETEG